MIPALLFSTKEAKPRAKPWCTPTQPFSVKAAVEMPAARSRSGRVGMVRGRERSPSVTPWPLGWSPVNMVLGEGAVTALAAMCCSKRTPPRAKCSSTRGAVSRR